MASRSAAFEKLTVAYLAPTTMSLKPVFFPNLALARLCLHAYIKSGEQGVPYKYIQYVN